MDQLNDLVALEERLVAEIAELTAQRQEIYDNASKEERKTLNADESAEFRAKSNGIKEIQLALVDVREQIKDLQAEVERSGRLNKDVVAVQRATVTVEVKEPLTYQRGNVKQSYFRDIANVAIGMADEATKERLQRHAKDVETNSEIKRLAKVGNEYRALDRSDGTGGYFVPPLWMMQRFIELARAGKAYANLVPTEPLPPGTDSINIPKVATGTSTAIQTADNATISETDLTDTSVQANVKTIAGAQGIAIQLLDQSPIAFDELIFRDLARDYATKLDLQVISGSNSNGQVQGIRGTSNIITIAATSSGTELEKAQVIFKKIADAIQRVHTERFEAPEVIVMHPRRWAAFTALFDGENRPLIVTNGPAVNQIATAAGVVSQTTVGAMHGLPVVTDPNLPITLGTGTNEDVIHVLKVSDLLLFESAVRTRALQETRAENLTVLLQIYGYLAFTAARFPKGIVEIGGTALTTPTFA